MKNLNLAIVDVETTGGSAFDRIIEIGIIRIEKGKVVEKFNSLIDPEQPISRFITNLTGIRDADVERAPTFISIQETVQNLLDDCVFVAHNAPFDYQFITHEFKNIGGEYSAPRLCTVRLSRALYPRYKRHNLDSVIERCGLRCKNRHRALDDAKVVWDFIRHVEKKFSPEKISKTVTRLVTEGQAGRG